MSDPSSVPGPPGFDLDDFCARREAEAASVEAARRALDTREQRRRQFREAVGRLHSGDSELRRDLGRAPTGGEVAAAQADYLTTLVNLAREDGLAPEGWPITPDARPDQSRELKEEQQAVCDLWARAVEGKRDELAQCIERLLGVPDNGHIARAYYRWLPDKLREAYDRAGEWVARQKATETEGVRERATSVPPTSAIGALLGFVRAHTQTLLSPGEIAELRRLDEEAGAAIEWAGRELFAVVTPGSNYGHFGRCKIPYYAVSPHVPLSPNEEWYRQMARLEQELASTVPREAPSAPPAQERGELPLTPMWDHAPLSPESWGTIRAFDDGTGDGQMLRVRRWINGTPSARMTNTPPTYRPAAAPLPLFYQNGGERLFYVPSERDRELVARLLPDAEDPMNPPWPQVEALLVLAGHTKQELATLAPPALLALLHRCDLAQLQESTRGACPGAADEGDLASESAPGASTQRAEGVGQDARTELQGDNPEGETLPTGRAADILLVMDQEGWASPERCASQDTIAGAVKEGLTRESLQRPFARLRTLGLIATTGKGGDAGTYLTEEGSRVVGRLRSQQSR